MMLEDAREQLIAALLKLSCLQHREGRDDVVDDLPEEIGSRIKRRQNLAADVRAIVKTCIQYETDLASLFAILENREGNSRPFQRARGAWENYKNQIPAGEDTAGNSRRGSDAPPVPVPTMTFAEQVENILGIIRHGRREQTLFILSTLCAGLAYFVKVSRWEKLPELLYVLAGILLVWGAVLVLVKAISRSKEISEGVGPGVIKGPFPFGETDGEVFARLGRRADLEKILGWVLDPQTGFTALLGESGAGKTSLLRAGLVYILQRKKAQYGITPVYWEAVPDNPGEALLRAVCLACPEEAERLQTLDDLLDDSAGSPKAIIIDQAEQLSPKKHPALFELFRKIAARKVPHRTTWIIAFREEYAAVWFELEATEFKVQPHKHAVKTFSEAQARENMEVLARESGLAPEKAVLDEMVGAMSDDGRISPVEIGIGMMVLSELYRDPGSELSLRKFHDAGGVTGLLRAYIRERLEENIPAHERSPLQSALLELIDPETPRQRLAQGKTAPELAAGLQLPLNRLRFNLRYLASQRVRILEQLPGAPPAEAEPRYRLAHERLIPALESLAGKMLAAAEQAWRLLNERYRIWAKTKRWKFLLTGRELWEVLKYRRHFQEGISPELRQYLRRSKRKRNLNFTAGALVLLAVILWEPFDKIVLEHLKREWRFRGFNKENLVKVPAGDFEMGDSLQMPVHTVKLDSFWISPCEITNQQYCDFLNADDSAAENAGKWINDSTLTNIGKLLAIGGLYCQIDTSEDGQFYVEKEQENHPVVTVSWYGAAAFANYLNRRKGYPQFYDFEKGTCNFSARGYYRLPTEAEWEYACRAGTVTPFNTGENLTTDQANYDGNYPYGDFPKGRYLGKTTPVGSYPPNAWGLYDMHGNVWEWCADWYGRNYYEICKDSGIVANPTGPEEGSDRVLRGGSWLHYAQFCRSAYRYRYVPAGRFNYIGFRLVFVP